MAAGNNSNFGDEIKFNVDVAKQMTVPDEIKLTGPTDSLEGHQSQSFTSQMVVPDDITFTTSLRSRDNSHRETVKSSSDERLVVITGSNQSSMGYIWYPLIFGHFLLRLWNLIADYGFLAAVWNLVLSNTWLQDCTCTMCGSSSLLIFMFKGLPVIPSILYTTM